MNNNIVIIGSTILGVIGLILLLSYLTYKKVDVKGLLSKIESFLTGAENITNIIEQYSEGKVKRADEFAKYLLEQAINFVQGTEQMYLSSQISSDERKNTAINAITNLLKVQNIDITDELKNVISMYVEKACGDDNIKTINEKIDKLIQEKVTPLQKEKEAIQVQLQSQTQSFQTQLQALQTQLASITADRDNLKNTLTNITTTANSTITQSTTVNTNTTPNQQ